MSFFGFDTNLPEHRGSQKQQSRPGFATNDSTSFGQGFQQPNAGEEEDLAVYNWGDGGATNLLEGGDDMNDETFGDVGDVGESRDWDIRYYTCIVTDEVGRDFQWANPAPVAPASKQGTKPRGPIASTASRYGPKTVYDPFAASEDDFYAPRPSSMSSRT
jgi:DNA topoisomerase 2-associated protein PAT1